MKTTRTVLLPILIVLVPAALLYLHLRIHKQSQALAWTLHDIDTRSEAHEVSLRIRSHLEERTNDLKVLAEVWRAHRHDKDHSHFRRIAQSFITDDPCYHAINYVDAESIVRATVPKSNESALLGRDLKALPGRVTMHAQARQAGHPLASPPVVLVGQHPGFVIWHALRHPETEAFDGFAAAALKINDLIASVLKQMPGNSFGHVILMDDAVIFGAAPEGTAAHLREENFRALGRRWTVRAWPQPGAALTQLPASMDWHFHVGIALSLVTGALLLVVAWVNRDLRRTQRELRASEENLRITLDSIGDAVIATDTDGRVQGMNPVAEEVTGWPLAEAAGRPLDTVFRIVNAQTREPAVNPVQQVLAKDQVIGLANDTLLIARNGREYQIADSGAPIRDGQGKTRGVVLVFRDVSEEYALQEQLRRSQKLQAIGQLAGGVAHDFNNMLGGILGAADLIELRLDPDSKLLGYCRMIQESAGRAAKLTEKLLAFARKQPPALSTIDIHATVNTAIDLLKNTVDPRIAISLQLDAAHHHIEGDDTQLQNAFLNIALNAAQAMPKGGSLIVTSRELALDHRSCLDSPFDLTPAPHIELEFRDSGTGIPAQDMEHIFEPFFTTKTAGQGTGLGLAAVYGTVQSHHGAITACSELGKGTSFHILLPLSDGSPAPTEQTQAEGATLTGTGHILIIDDEAVMRNTGAAMLEDLGYTVSTAINGREGLAAFKANPDSFDLVILDMVMPEMNGRDCFHALREIRPDARVLLSSGFTREGELEPLLAAGLQGFLRKPFRNADLAQLVREAMPG